MVATQLQKAERFRALHLRTEAIVIPNPCDIGIARILAGLGFEALATTSGGFAAAMGKRDGTMSRDEVLAHCRALAAATDLPVSADLEKCFGDDPATVAQTIRLAAETGVVGGSVEDWSGRAIYDFDHAVERVAAAVKAARALPFPFTLTARAENFLRGRRDLEDTIRRLQAFEQAGADVLYAPFLPDLAAIKAVCGAVKKPVNVLAGRPPFTVAELAAAGVKRISVGSLLANVATGALLRAAREIKARGSFGFAESAASTKEVSEFMGS